MGLEWEMGKATNFKGLCTKNEIFSFPYFKENFKF